MSPRELRRHPDAAALAAAVARRLVASVVLAQAQRGVAHVVLTGGGIGTAVLVALAANPDTAQIDWQRIHLWWGDERYVPEGDPERNETGARAALIDHIPIPPGRVHAMAGPDRAASVEESAASYADLLNEVGEGSVPEFDVLLLGIGPDAHVASLFPEHPAWRETGEVVAVHDSPKPPPLRVSMSLPTLNRARQSWVLASGASKQDAVLWSFDEQATATAVPASGISGSQQTLFLVDEAAAAELPPNVGQSDA
ncbi:MAG: 6-phosphogluconolactonase [Actinomycetota bacterium]|nr:6-phosphogluconolactonase [Actinomycetota bacterium]